MDDVKARLAEVLADHAGKAGIVFDQENALAHGNISLDASAPTAQFWNEAMKSAIFRRCSGLSTSEASLERLGDALARGLGERDLVRPHPIDGGAVDGRRRQQRDALGAQRLRLLPQRQEIIDGGLRGAGEPRLLVGGCVELDRQVLGHAVDPIIDLRLAHGPAHEAEVVPAIVLGERLGQ